MRPALAYSPGRSPLHRAPLWIALSFLGVLAAIAFAYANPLVLVADGVAAALVGALAGAGRAVRAGLRLAWPLVLLMVAVNAIVSHRGETVLLRGWELPVIGSTDVTLESLATGASIGLRVAVVVLVFAVYSACIDPDRVLRALRPLARRSALTAALVVRMVPVTAGDAARLREAAALRGPGAAPVGRAALLRRLVEGSLDRAIDIAATLELRGHGLEVRPIPRRERRRRLLGLLGATAGLGAIAAAGLVLGAAGFDSYPDLEVAVDPATLALCAAVPLIAALPFLGARDG